MSLISTHRKAQRTNRASGLFAEALCRLSLRLRGNSVLAKRYRSPLGEIDNGGRADV